MRSEQDIKFGQLAQHLILDVPEGRPRVISAEVFHLNEGDDSGKEDAISSPCLEVNPNTTLGALAGISQADQRNLPVVAATGIVGGGGRLYLLEGANGQREWVEPMEVIVATPALTLRHQLENDYTAAATFQSTRIKARVLDSWVTDTSHLSDDGDPNPGYRVRWVYEITRGGVCTREVRDTYFDLLRLEGMHDVRAADVFETFDVIKHSMPTDHRSDELRTLIDRAYHEVRIDFQTASKADEMIRNRTVMNNLVTWKTAVLWALNAFLESGVDDGRHDALDKAYNTKFDKLIQVTPNTAMASGTSGAAEPQRGSPIWGPR